MPRLATDGNGNLFIDDETHPDHGKLVKYHEGSFVEVSPNEPNHNATHEQQVLTIDGTRDADQVTAAALEVGQDPDNYAFLVNAGDGVNMHHYEVQSDDAHADGIKVLPDSLAPVMTSHTDAWKEA